MGPQDLQPDDVVLLRVTADHVSGRTAPAAPPHAWVVATPQEAAQVLVPAAYQVVRGRDLSAKADTEGRFVGADRVIGFILVHGGEHLRCGGDLWEVVDPAARAAWRQLFERARAALA